MGPFAKFVALRGRMAVLLSHCFLSTDGERNHIRGAQCAASGTFVLFSGHLRESTEKELSLAPVGKAQHSIFPLQGFLSAQCT